jgi:hypothetical protein
MRHFLFLSHSGNDSEAALALARRLEESPEAKGKLEVFFDQRDLPAGGRWKAELEQALKRATAFVVYTGTRGIANWVRDEVDVALDRAHEDPAFPLIPVLAPGADLSLLPGFLAQFQAVVGVENDADAFAKLLRGVLRIEPRQAVAAEREPFVGLNAFESSKAHLFFGRKNETRDVLELLREESLVMVTGDSGSGKSSLVKAGVLPAFRGGALAPPREKGPDETVWYTLETRPGLDPFHGLADQVLKLASRLGKPAEEASGLANLIRKKDVNRSPQRDPDDVRNALLVCTQPPTDRPGKLLLLVDQFEEIRNLEDADEFVATLLRLASDGDDRIRVVLTMRRDYYYICSSFEELYERLERNERKARYLLRRMSPYGLRACVIEPLSLTTVSESEREELAAVILKDVGDQAGELALLEMALDRTWSARKKHDGRLVAAYAAIGRVEGALAQAAEEVYQALLPEEQSRVETLFVRLVWPGESGGVTRRIARLGEFDESLQDLARKLANKEHERLLTLGEDTVEMTHEQLATQWIRCQAWVGNKPGDPRGDDLRLLQGLIADALRWQIAGDEDKTDCLAKGVDLKVYRKLAETRPAWLTSSEHGFVEISLSANLDEVKRKELAARKFRRLFEVAATVALIALAAAAVAGYFFLEARERTISLEAASLWHPLEFTEAEVVPAEIRALRQLAAADDDVREEFVEQMLASDELSLRFSRAPKRFVQALQGLRIDRRRVIQRLMIGWNEEQKTKLRAARLGYLVELEAPEAVHLGLELLEAPTEPVLDSGAFQLIERLPPDELPRALDGIITALSRTQLQQDAEVQGFLVDVIVSNANRLSVTQFEKAFSMLLSRIRAAPDVFSTETASDQLVALLESIDARQANQAAGLLEAEINKKNRISDLAVLASGLESAAKQLGARHVQLLGTSVLQAIPGGRRYPEYLEVIKCVYAAKVAANVPPDLEASAVDTLVKESRKFTKNDEITDLADLLTAMIKMVKVERRSRAVDSLLAEITSARVTSAQLRILGKSLAYLRAELNGEQNAKLASFFRSALDPGADRDLSGAVAILSKSVSLNLTEAQSARITDLFLDRTRRSDFSETWAELYFLRGNLENVARNLPSGQAKRANLAFLRMWTSSYEFSLRSGEYPPHEAADPYLPKLLDRIVGDDLMRFIDELRNLTKGRDQRILERTFEAAVGRLDPAQRLELSSSILANLERVTPGDEASHLAWEMRWLQLELTESQWVKLAGLVSPDLLSELADGKSDWGRVLATFCSSAEYWALTEFIGLAGTVPGQRAPALAAATSAAIFKTTDPARLTILLKVLLAIANRLQPEEAASVMFEAIKDPGLDRDVVAAGIRDRFKDLSPPTGSYWDLIEWGRKQFPGVDFEALPKFFEGAAFAQTAKVRRKSAPAELEHAGGEAVGVQVVEPGFLLGTELVAGAFDFP